MLASKRVLGIDPGSRIAGWGLLELVGSDSRYLASGTIRLGDGDIPQRLYKLHQALADIIGHWQPQLMAVEQVFVMRNADSALKLGQARGVILCAAAAVALEIHEYAPRRIKQAVVGSGAATKNQIQVMVQQLLKLDALPQSDEADALAVALCHAHEARLVEKLPALATELAGSGRGRRRGGWRSVKL